MGDKHYERKMAAGMRQTTVWLTADQHRAARVLAAQNDMSLGDFLSWAVRCHVERLNAPSVN